MRTYARTSTATLTVTVRPAKGALASIVTTCFTWSTFLIHAFMPFPSFTLSPFLSPAGAFSIGISAVNSVW